MKAEKHTIHLSRESASAPELVTSKGMPLRFINISCSFSKFVRGGGICRLEIQQSARNHAIWQCASHLNTAVIGNASLIFCATLMLAKSINSSTRLFVSRISFCSTSIGSDDSALCRWILTSGDARFKAPARIRPARSFWASPLRRRMETVMSSERLLGRMSIW